MKKIIVLLVFALSTGAVNSYANAFDPDPEQRVLDGFKKEFPTAQQVTWSKQAEFEKAVFVLAGRRVVAFFTREGLLEGSARDIFYDQLPLSVMTAVDKRFENATVFEVREINNAEGTCYRMRVESGNKKVKIKVSPDGTISEIEKLK